MKKLAILLVMLLAFTMCTANAVFEGMTTYSAGQYHVGYDIPVGEYMLVGTSDYGGYFAITTDANGRDIFANDNFEVNSIVTVKFGEYLELSRCIAIPSAEFYTQYTVKSSNPGVMLKVGYDIMPGTYKLRGTSSQYHGYWCIYNDSRHDDIVENDLFDGQAYVTVSRGQYLVLSRCVIAD